jgi:hypothetical protein
MSKPERGPDKAEVIAFRALTEEPVAYLASIYGWTRDRAVRVLAIADWCGIKAEPTKGGYVLVTLEEGSYVIEDHTG